MSVTEITAIASLITSLIAIIGLIITFFRLKPQERVDDSTAALNYQKVAAAATQERIDLAGEVKKDKEQYMTRIKDLEARVTDLENQLKEACERTAKFEEWARRLEFQVRSLDGIPVLLDTVRRGELVEKKQK